MFEGIDGVGKTTQLAWVEAALKHEGWDVMDTRNLGGTPIGEELRKVMKLSLERPPTTDLYISLAIQEPLLDLIDEERKKGTIILMDRGPLSLAAYQMYGAGLDEKLVWPHVTAAMERIRPEAVLLYEAGPEVALGRITEEAKKSDYFESKPLEYFQRVAEGYKKAAAHYPQVTTISATGPIAAVNNHTMGVVSPLLGMKQETFFR